MTGRSQSGPSGSKTTTNYGVGIIVVTAAKPAFPNDSAIRTHFGEKEVDAVSQYIPGADKTAVRDSFERRQTAVQNAIPLDLWGGEWRAPAIQCQAEQDA